jgi:hypothetical protein
LFLPLTVRPARRFQPGATGSIAGFVLIVLTILKIWWDSRLAFFSGVVYLLVLKAVYLLLRNTSRPLQRRHERRRDYDVRLGRRTRQTRRVVP